MDPPVRAAPEEMFTIRPPPVARSLGLASRMQKNAPSRFTASVRRQVSSSMSARRSIRRPIPALFTRASRRLNRSSTAANIRATAAASLTSACKATAVPPSEPMAAAVASASPRRDAKLTTTAYPAAASASAILRPIPREAPVTSATLLMIVDCTSSPTPLVSAIGCRSCFPASPARRILAPVAQVTIRQLTVDDRGAAVDVINTAARWYRDFLPPDELHDPEMTAAQWDEEARRLAWYGGFLDGSLVAVMGLEYARDAALLRHAYILPEHQHHGIGLRLTEHLESEARRDGAAHGIRRIIVGTYARNYKARGALEKAGYRLSADSGAILREYYVIPQDRLRTS